MPLLLLGGKAGLLSPGSPGSVGLAGRMRDRDVRNAAKVALEATGAFGLVALSGLPENYGFGASEFGVCVISPDSDAFQGQGDTVPDGLMIINGRATLTILARHEDPQLRDELAERLLYVAANALNGNKLGSLVVPSHSYVTQARYMTETPPERRVTALFSYQWISSRWDNVDVSE